MATLRFHFLPHLGPYQFSTAILLQLVPAGVQGGQSLLAGLYSR